MAGISCLMTKLIAIANNRATNQKQNIQRPVDSAMMPIKMFKTVIGGGKMKRIPLLLLLLLTFLTFSGCAHRELNKQEKFLAASLVPS